MSRFKVDFIGVGVPRCATTWVSSCLAAHPRIGFSSMKETHFFDKIFKADDDLSLYESYFTEDPEKIRGEFTPAYYQDENIAKTIKKFFPAVKIIVCLRNPVERAFSHYVYSKRKGSGGKQSFKEIIRPEHPLIKRGFYYRYLSRFLSHFDKQQVIILYYDEIRRNPIAVLEKLYRFLGVDPAFRPDRLAKKHNASDHIGYKYLFINRIIHNMRKKLAAVPCNRNIRYLLRVSGIRKVVGFILKKNRDTNVKAVQEVPDRDSVEKLKEIYRADIICLEKYLETDLQAWYR